MLWFGTQSELVTFVFPTLTVWDTHTVDTWDGGVVAYIVNRVCGLGLSLHRAPVRMARVGFGYVHDTFTVRRPALAYMACGLGHTNH